MQLITEANRTTGKYSQGEPSRDSNLRTKSKAKAVNLETNQRVMTRDRPVIVDLDGTLLRGDLFWDSLFLSLRRRPATLFKLCGWLMGGIAHLKAQLAETAKIDPANLPYREEVLQELRLRKSNGQHIVLATGSNEKLAHAVADHLDLFDEVMASDSRTNLTGSKKLDRIKSEFGDRDFEYYGNSRNDLCLFEAASSATVVAPDWAASRWQKRSRARRIDEKKSTLIAALRAMRPQQWLKNTLIFVPAILAHKIFEVPVALSAFLAFMSFCFAASSIYIVNDLLDLDADRRHATKRNRPLASGHLSHPAALATAGICLVLSLTIAAFLPLGFLAILLGYLVATTAYSVAIKRMLLLDILVLAGLYAARVQAGAAAAQIEYSFWLVAFSAFFFLSLALVKRFNELQQVGTAASRATTGRGYRFQDSAPIAQAGMASGFASVLVLALYIDSPEIEEAYGNPHLVWLLCPIVLYLVMRVWILAGRGHMNEDPVVFILNDWRSQLMVAFGCILFLLAIAL